METRLIVAYALIALMVIGVPALLALAYRRRAQRRRLRRGYRHHSEKPAAPRGDA